MRIGIDVRFMLPGQVGGSEVYVRNLVKALAVAGEGHEYFLFTNPQNAGSFGLESVPHISEHGEWGFSEGLDVLFFPGTTMLPLRSRHKRVVVVHDIQHEFQPRNFSLRERFRRWRRDRPSITHAERVIAVSDFTRTTVLQKYRLPGAKITAIHPGVEESFFNRLPEEALVTLRRRYHLPDLFVLYPARFWPHKNHARLFSALRILRERFNHNCQLVLCGEPSQDSLPDGVIGLGHVPRRDLPGLYQAAMALVFPSLYEGFGLPVLEAMAASCPVACSRAASLPEVAGDAALYFDPCQPETIAAALHRVLTDRQQREELAARGLARARSFSWERCARQTVAVLVG